MYLACGLLRSYFFLHHLLTMDYTGATASIARTGGVQGETRHPHSAEILESQEVPGRVEQTDVSYTHSMHAGRQKEMETSSGSVEGDR